MLYHFKARKLTTNAAASATAVAAAAVADGVSMTARFAQQDRQGHVSQDIGVVRFHHFFKLVDRIGVLARPFQGFGFFEEFGSGGHGGLSRRRARTYIAITQM